MELTSELKNLFNRVRVSLGAPVRQIQLDDNQLCALLENCIGDYASYVQNWVIESNWLTLNGNKGFITDPSELAFALTTKNLQWSKDYSQWFSKEVGLQQVGTKWELKKDFFQVERGKQCYLIPAGREINKVMYVTPSTTRAALYGAFGALDGGFGGGFAQFGNIANGIGLPSFYMGSAYDATLLAADLKYKNNLLRGDMTYKVTAGPDGTHIVHLLSVPGSPNQMSGLAADDTMWQWNKYVGCYVWYTYYDTSASDGDTMACLLDNKNDILITPDQIPLEEMRYELMNNPTQQTIRQLLTAEAMITLGLIRGTFSGTIKIPNAEMQMDYNMFLDMGKTEKEKVLTELKERLERMLPWNLMKNQSEMMDALLNVKKVQPFPTPIIVI